MARLEMGENEAVLASRDTSGDLFFRLGLMYATGRDVPTDLVSAHKWFNLAAMRGNRAARDYRGEIASEMSRSDLAEALRQARAWSTTH